MYKGKVIVVSFLFFPFPSSFLHQVALNQRYNDKLNSASDILSKALKEQASLMEEVRSARFLCVASAEQHASSVIFIFLAAPRSQGPSAENRPPAPAAEPEGGRRAERARRVHVGEGSGC